MGQNIDYLRKQGIIAQSVLISFNIHNIKPGDWVLIKGWKEENLTPNGKGCI